MAKLSFRVDVTLALILSCLSSTFCSAEEGSCPSPKNLLRNKISCFPECTLVMIKPDGVARGLVGKIVKRFESKGFNLVAMKYVHADKATLEAHYEEHADKEFFQPLLDYMSSGPVIPMVWEGPNVIKESRKMIGATNPLEASPGTIRGDWCTSTQQNLIHGSSSSESSKREILLWFPESEVVSILKKNYETVQ